MEIVLIVFGIFILYWRCLKYHYLIDDIVRRWEYLYVVPDTSPHPSFYSMRPSAWRHLFLIITHAINVTIIYFLWGWVPALLFAFHPLAVPMTAWITGGYYAVTTLLTLTAYFFLHTYPNIIGAGISAIFFTAALGSTITCLGFPFIFLILNHWGLWLFWPMFMYLGGRRFGKGYQIRDLGKKDKFSLKKIPVMTKTLAYYLYKFVFPYRLSFFHAFGENYTNDTKVRKNMESVNGWFWLSATSILLFILIGWQFSPLGVIWLLCTIAPFSQFKVLGQFVAERYQYLPLVGWCLILANALAPYPALLALVTVLYILKSHQYIPAYDKIESLYEHGIRSNPDCLANYANLGERYIHTGLLKKGYETLQDGLKIDPENFLCFCNTAAFWVQVRDIQKGMYFTEKGMELGKTRSSWLIIQAMRQQLNGLMEYDKMVRKAWREEAFPNALAVGK